MSRQLPWTVLFERDLHHKLVSSCPQVLIVNALSVPNHADRASFIHRPVHTILNTEAFKWGNNYFLVNINNTNLSYQESKNLFYKKDKFLINFDFVDVTLHKDEIVENIELFWYSPGGMALEAVFVYDPWQPKHKVVN